MFSATYYEMLHISVVQLYLDLAFFNMIYMSVVNESIIILWILKEHFFSIHPSNTPPPPFHYHQGKLLESSFN